MKGAGVTLRGGAEAELVQLAAFRVGDEEYAIDIMRIREIINPLRLTKVPKAPPFVEGVIELRGAILPILDLRKRFEAAKPILTRATKYVIIAIEGRMLGLIVDAVTEVIRVPADTIKPPPDLSVTEGDASLFSGVCHIGDRIIMVLDLDQMLTPKERGQLGAPSPAPAAAAAAAGPEGEPRE